MSENAEVVRSILSAWNEAEIERMASLIAEDGELLPLRAQLEGTAYVGPDGMRRFWADLNADWENLTLSVDELREIDDKVLVIGGLHARGRTSGVSIDVQIGQVWQLRDGCVVHMAAYSDPEDAWRAAGLEQ